MEYITREELLIKQLESPGRKLKRSIGMQVVCVVSTNYNKLIAKSLDNLTVGMGEIIEYIREQKQNEENRRNRNKKKKRGKVVRTSKK